MRRNNARMYFIVLRYIYYMYAPSKWLDGYTHQQGSGDTNNIHFIVKLRKGISPFKIPLVKYISK